MTLWTAAFQASLSITISQSLSKIMFMALVMSAQPLHPLMPSSPSALDLSRHQELFQLVICLHQMA